MQAPVRPSERELADELLADAAPAPTASIPPPPPSLAAVADSAAPGSAPSTPPAPIAVAPGAAFPPPTFAPPTAESAAPIPVALPAVAPLAPTPLQPIAQAVQSVPPVATPAPTPVAAAPNPVAAAPITLPTLAAAPPPAVPIPQSVPTGHHPTQHGAQSAAEWAAAHATVPTTTRPRKAKSAPGRGVVRTLMVAILAVAIGAGARIGYDRYEARDDVAQPTRPVVDGNVLSAWPNIAPPAIRFTDTETMIHTAAGSRALTTHRDLTTGDRIVNVVETDQSGAVVSYDLDIRADEAYLRTAPDAAWEPLPVDAAVGLLGDEMLTAVFTVSDIFPSQATPFTTVLESVDRQFSLGAIQQNAIVTDTIAGDVAPGDVAPADVAPVVLAPGATVPTPVTHYRVILDVEAFRAADAAAFQTWERQLGRVASPRLEVWVDADGVVRQIVFEIDGVRVTHKLVAGAPVSDQFDVPNAGALDPVGAPRDGEVGG